MSGCERTREANNSYFTGNSGVFGFMVLFFCFWHMYVRMLYSVFSLSGNRLLWI